MPTYTQHYRACFAERQGRWLAGKSPGIRLNPDQRCRNHWDIPNSKRP